MKLKNRQRFFWGKTEIMSLFELNFQIDNLNSRQSLKTRIRWAGILPEIEFFKCLIIFFFICRFNNYLLYFVEVILKNLFGKFNRTFI